MGPPDDQRVGSPGLLPAPMGLSPQVSQALPLPVASPPSSTPIPRGHNSTEPWERSTLSLGRRDVTRDGGKQGRQPGRGGACTTHRAAGTQEVISQPGGRRKARGREVCPSRGP